MRLLLLAAAVGVSSAALAPRQDSAIEIVVVENWTRQPINSRGVPETWRAYETPGGHPAYDFTIVDVDRRRALRMRSKDDHSTIAKKVQIDLETTPWVEWSWKVVTLPEGADLRRRETSDAAAHLYVIWPRWPATLRSRLVGYVWDASLPVGSVQKSMKAGAVTFIVVRSGQAQLGQWLTERRNVREDYRLAFGEEPENPALVALSIDTNDTRAFTETFIGQIRFRSGTSAAVE